jgi:hypothetical protein
MRDTLTLLALAGCGGFIAGYACALWNHAAALLRRHGRSRRA